MANRYEESLRVELRNRYLRLYKSPADDLQRHCTYLRDWVARHRGVRGILDAIEAADPEFDPGQWVDEQLAGGRRGEYELPDSEVNLARVGWRIVDALGSDEMSTRQVLAFSWERNFNDAANEVVARLIEPLFDYVESRLSFGDELLHVLGRYRDSVAWFERPRLLDAFRDDTARGERTLDNDLRKFIFNQGYDFPFSQPRGPSGDVDVLADLGSDPLPCEVKVFDGDGRGIGYLASGVSQARSYAVDYGVTAGYLVIFNVSDEVIELPSDDSEARWPPRLDIAGVSVFIVEVDLAERPSASRRGRIAPVSIDRAQLVGGAES